ncbi:KpsF/GutQ family sugar-phosphate isomerase [Polycladidibacter stylochi]|uniref:KpsF/GutQ family sugar-phosphate isomerase n=1 Tax=Polycladidibacter stylochi TaxID=1807766 RepID=UPI00082C4EE7|nr:KpsF/GutQ family sugar-phosphate isomerase [Pseudovibrio stylochi]
MSIPHAPISRASHSATAQWIETAKSSLETENKAMNELLAAMDNQLAEPFIQAVKTIADCQGRVIISGIGKSGHVGNKIAATLASTGTPAFFVHASEASHGDLGMITSDDVIIGISWSGETQELSSLLAFTRRFRIPLIAITSKANSSLGKAADVKLILPKVEESCPHGLAPTSSTLIQMAIGDALAVTLIKARNFSAQDFKVFHPGGKLGANLLTVADIMHTGSAIPLIKQGELMREAIILMTQKGFGTVGVINDDGQLTGIVTDGDLRRHISSNFLDLTVDKIMTVNPTVISKDALLASSLELLQFKAISSLFIVEDNRPVGIIHLHDLLRVGAL